MAKEGNAYIEIKPDLSGFKRELKAELEKIRVTLTVAIKPDTRRFKQELTKLAGDAGVQNASKQVGQSSGKKLSDGLAEGIRKDGGRKATKTVHQVARKLGFELEKGGELAGLKFVAGVQSTTKRLGLRMRTAGKDASGQFIRAFDPKTGLETKFKLAAKTVDRTTAQMAKKLGLDFGKSGQLAGLRWVAGVEREVKRLGLVMGRAGRDAQGHFINAFDPARGLEVKFRHAARTITRTTSQLAHDLGLQFERGGELAGLRWVSKVEGEVKKLGLSITRAGKDIAGNFIEALDPVSGISTVFRQADGVVKKASKSMRLSLGKLLTVGRAIFAQGTLIALGIFIIGSIAGSVIQIINHLVGAVLALASALAQAAVGGGIALVGVMLALGQAMLTVKWVTGDLSDAIKTQNKILEDQAAGLKVSQADWDELRKTMKKLAPSAQKFVKAWGEVSQALDQVKKKVQERLFAGLDRALTNTSKKVLPVFEKGLSETAGALNGAAKGFGEWLSKGETTGLIATVMHNNSVAIGKLANACVPLLDIILRLWVAFDPLIQLVADSIGTWLKSADATVKAKEKSGDLADTVERLKKNLKKVASIIDNVLSGIQSTFGAASGSGDNLLDTIDRITKKWADWAKSPEGQKQIKKFTDEALPTLKELGGMALDFLHWWSDMSKTGKAKDLISDLKKLSSAVGELIHQLSGDPKNGNAIATWAQILQDLADSHIVADLSKAAAEMFKIVAFVGKIAGAKLPFDIPNPLSTPGYKLIAFYFESIYNFYVELYEFGGYIGRKIREGWDQVWKALSSSASLASIVTAAKTTFTKTVTAVKTALSDIATAVTSKLENVKTLFVNAFNFVVDSAREFPQNLITAIGSFDFLFSGIGEAIVHGIWDGMKGQGGWLADKIKGFVLDFIKNPFSISIESHSPSKWTRDEVGKPIGQGVAWGMNLTRSLVEQAALNLSLAATPPIPALAGVGMGAGASDVAVNSAAPAGAQANPTIRVYIGERELTDIVRVTVDGRNEDMARALLTGRRL